jgi:hypothetical protein
MCSVHPVNMCSVHPVNMCSVYPVNTCSVHPVNMCSVYPVKNPACMEVEPRESGSANRTLIITTHTDRTDTVTNRDVQAETYAEAQAFTGTQGPHKESHTGTQGQAQRQTQRQARRQTQR